MGKGARRKTAEKKMRNLRIAVVVGAIGAFVLGLALPAANAATPAPTSVSKSRLTSLLQTSPETNSSTYDRSLFVHWIDADGNGCNTRDEVLIQESLIKPTVGSGCAISGGKWYSVYDDKTFTVASQLDIDHFVPLKEAWESGAWAWTPDQRKAFANDLGYADSLRAVSAASNRSKSDGDPADWLPPFAGFRCTYLENWVLVKYRWSLAADSRELSVLNNDLANCPDVQLTLPEVVAGIPSVGGAVQPSASPSASASSSPSPSASATPNKTGNPIPVPSSSSKTTAITKLPLIHAGAFCKSSLKGKKGKNASGVVYTCKTAPYDSRLRWRR